MTFETCHLVPDRPRQGAPHSLLYVAEVTAGGATRKLATSPVFHPELDLTAHRAALAALEAELARDGWVRYNRWCSRRCLEQPQHESKLSGHGHACTVPIALALTRRNCDTIPRAVIEIFDLQLA